MEKRVEAKRRFHATNFRKLAVKKYLAKSKLQRHELISALRNAESAKEVIRGILTESCDVDDEKWLRAGGIAETLDWTDFLDAVENVDLFTEIESSLLKELECESTEIQCDDDGFEVADNFDIEAIVCPFCWIGALVSDHQHAHYLHCHSCKGTISLRDRRSGYIATLAELQHLLSSVFERHTQQCASCSISHSMDSGDAMSLSMGSASESAGSGTKLGGTLVFQKENDIIVARCVRCNFVELVS